MRIPYGKQSILEEDIEAVNTILRSDFLTQGPAVLDFEQAFAEEVGSKHAVSFNNATSALHLAFKTLNRDLKKKVIVTPMTFAASSNCVLFDGGNVDFADIDPVTLNIDPDKVESLLKKNPSLYQGLVIVDFGGLPINMEDFDTLAKKYDLWIIEDACHAIGGSFTDSQDRTVKCGSNLYNQLTTFSFHPVKHIATGEGGMLTTNNEETYRQLLRLRSHGMERDPNSFQNQNDGGWYHEMQDLGYNYRMSDINAALGHSQLRRLGSNIKRRNEISRRYRTELADLPLRFQEFDETKFNHAYHLFVVQTSFRKELYEYLKESQIFTQVHYLPVYWHPYYQHQGFAKGLCPEAEAYYSKCLSLPMYHSLSHEEQSYVIERVRTFFRTRT